MLQNNQLADVNNVVIDAERKFNELCKKLSLTGKELSEVPKSGNESNSNTASASAPSSSQGASVVFQNLNESGLS